MTILKQSSRYCGTAVISAVSDWLVFSSLAFAGVNFVVAQMVSRIFGGLVSFFINRSWSFQKTEDLHISIQGRRFLLLYGFSYSLSIFLIYALTEWISLSGYISKVIADTACFCFNFILMRTYVFDNRGGIITRLRGTSEAVKKPTQPHSG